MPLKNYRPDRGTLMSLLRAYALRWRRRRFCWRARRAARDLTTVTDRTDRIGGNAILLFLCFRDEMERLPAFVSHYRGLGVDHILAVDNGSSDGSDRFLSEQPDVSLWRTTASYRASRFGMDWINALLGRYGAGHWCLTVDADELWMGPARLPDVTAALEREGREVQGALMLELYPDGPLGAQSFGSGDDPLLLLKGFDARGYSARVQPRFGQLWVQGGPRARAFFRARPDHAPTLNKTPLVHWRKGYAYVSSTHSLLPRRLNDWRGGENALLLHTKFLPSVVERSRTERARGEHFGEPELYDAYYEALAEGPTLWHAETAAFEGWAQAKELGLTRISDPASPALAAIYSQALNA
ncbi:glycosyltransferase family 2 protein [Ovoidimarina sediminis]|uniref:glycosyltransferase family 2 protein n=1 Tax=Ovoidimarina sediminis TaxID=3079856 RepID=UPI00293167A6|nr:glycosyltransferase family 2 protein [Rhodophyticola sp. MJ-SS7]